MKSNVLLHKSFPHVPGVGEGGGVQGVLTVSIRFWGGGDRQVITRGMDILRLIEMDMDITRMMKTDMNIITFAGNLNRHVHDSEGQLQI